MKVGIHQPNFMPWSGFFGKMVLCDCFVLFDDVQYERKEYHNRVKIRTEKGEEWLTVPVKHQPRETLIKDILVDTTKDWRVGHLKKIEMHYSRAKNFQNVFPKIAAVYSKNHQYLVALNADLIILFKELLNLRATITFASEMRIASKGSDKVLEICLALKADKYYTGTSWAKDNLRVEDFNKNNIEVIFLTPEEIMQKPYQQQYEPFLPYCSELDFLMNGDY